MTGPPFTPVDSERTIALEDDLHAALVASRVFRLTLIGALVAVALCVGAVVAGTLLAANVGESAASALLCVFGIIGAILAVGAGGYLLHGQLYQRRAADDASELEFPSERAARLRRALERSRQADVDAWYAARTEEDK